MEQVIDKQSGQLVLDRYRMGARIGAGASGSVFAAEDEQLHTKVVIKLFDGVSDGFSAWNDEMRLILRMSHPNVVPCLDVGFDQQLGMWTLVLARQEGGSLRRWMSTAAKRERLPVYSILRDIASALAFVHQKGVIHRENYIISMVCFHVGHLRPQRRRNKPCPLTVPAAARSALTSH